MKNAVMILAFLCFIETVSANVGSDTTIVIGAQQWMAKNLDVAFYRNGDPIPQVTDGTKWAYLTTGAWCYYNNDSAQGKTYGKLYNWYAVNDPRGLAPRGWHIPSDTDWTTMEKSLGGSTVAGGKMKEAGTLHWIDPNTGGNNTSGWAGLPGGCRSVNGFFSNVREVGWWWSSSENNISLSISRILSFTDGRISKSYGSKDYGYSVRCIKD